MRLDLSTLEAHLWESANILRGPVDAADFKTYIFPLLFRDTVTAQMPASVKQIVNEIDAIVRIVRFRGWQQTIAGEREVQKALRKTLLRYQLHREQELFDRAYAYIKEYY